MSCCGSWSSIFESACPNETLDKLTLLRGNRPCAIEHILKLAAFENDGSESDFVEQLLVIQRLDDDADAASDRCFACHQKFASAGDIIAARSRERIHINHDRFSGAGLD